MDHCAFALIGLVVLSGNLSCPLLPVAFPKGSGYPSCWKPKWRCLRVFFPETATKIPRLLPKDRRAFSPEFSATNIVDFLAIPGSLLKCVKRKADAGRRQRLLAAYLAFSRFSRQDTGVATILYNICVPHSSTTMDGQAVERHLDDRARPSNLRSHRGTALPAPQLHPPACARSL